MERGDGRHSLPLPPPVTGDDSAAAIEDAVASAAALMLRHRLFPRAMAWNIQQSVERVAEPASPSPSNAYARAGNDVTMGELHGRFSPQPARQTHAAVRGGGLAAAQLVMAAASDSDKMTLEDVARSFPLLQAVEGPTRTLNRSSFSSASNGSLDLDGEVHPHHRREKLLRAVGKFLVDGESVPRSGAAQKSASKYQMQDAVPMTINRIHVDEDQQHAAFQAMTISTYSDDDSATEMTDVAAVQAHQQHDRPVLQPVPTPSTSPLPPSARNGSNAGRRTVQARPRSPATPSSVSSAASSARSSASKKRTRGESTRRERERVDPVTLQFPKTKTPIAPSLARALLTGYGAKRCSVDECGKIAVSKGLCRGHGGGRRCQSPGCNKCAQSRSPFCWAHGGGKRCEAPGCRRSRKTKRFCVDHVEMETTVPLPPSSAPTTPPRSSPSVSPSSAASQVPFPPLKRQMSGDFGAHAAAGVDSDDSIGGRSTITTDSDVSSAYTGSFSASNKENAYGANAAASSMIVDQDGSSRSSKQFTQQPLQGHGYHHYQDAGERTGAFSPVIVGLHSDSAHMAGVPPLAGPRGVALPSLSEALMRTVPAKSQTDVRFPSASPPSSSVYASFTSSTMTFTQAEEKASAFPSRERPW